MEYAARDKERRERQKDTMKQSEAVLHDRQIDDSNRQEMTGWRPGEEDKSYETKVHEIMNLENSYGNIVLGVNRKQEYMFLVREKKRYHAPAIKAAQTTLEGGSKKVFSTHYGVYMTNSHDTKESAAAVKIPAQSAPDRLAGSLSLFTQARDQQGFKEMLPFTTMRTDREQIQMLEEKARDLREERTYRSAKEAGQLEIELQGLRHTLWQKQQMQQKINKKLKAAIKRPSKWLDDKMLPEAFMTAIYGEKPDDGNDDGEESNADGEETGTGGGETRAADEKI